MHKRRLQTKLVWIEEALVVECYYKCIIQKVSIWFPLDAGQLEAEVHGTVANGQMYIDSWFQ